MRNLLKLGLLAILASGIAVSTAASPPAHMWEIGPTERGRNFSVGMHSAPGPAGSGWYFDFPYPSARAGHVNYVTTATGSLLGKSRILIRYRIDAPAGVRLAPRESPQSPATLTLYFQRRGDNWSGKRAFEHYRWFATHANRVSLEPGQHEVTVPLDKHSWKSIVSARGDQVPLQFRDALANADRVGFVLGGGLSAGHGVYATGPARFTLLSFQVI